MSTTQFPTKSWKKESSEKHHISIEIINTINNMIKEDFTHLKSILIVKNGSIIYEKYLKGYSENTLHETACIFKSFLSALIGTALQNNLINSIDTKVVDIFPNRS